MTASVLICLALSVALMTGVWVLSLPLRRVSIIDAFWGPGFALLASACWFLSTADAWNGGQRLLWALTVVWGGRLGWHLSIRCFGEPTEDRRYAAMRDKRNPGFWWKSLGIVFWLQAVILWFVSLPLQFALAGSATALSPFLAGIAVLIWGTGFFFEAVGDRQLRRFRAQPENEGRVLDTGLWSLTRHPNYFGDFLVWWGFWLLSSGLGAPWWTVVSPVVMSAFLMKFSGVGLLEKDITSRRPEYAEYLRTTSAFFPWPGRSTPRETE